MNKSSIKLPWHAQGMAHEVIEHVGHQYIVVLEAVDRQIELYEVYLPGYVSGGEPVDVLDIINVDLRRELLLAIECKWREERIHAVSEMSYHARELRAEAQQEHAPLKVAA